MFEVLIVLLILLIAFDQVDLLKKYWWIILIGVVVFSNKNGFIGGSGESDKIMQGLPMKAIAESQKPSYGQQSPKSSSDVVQGAKFSQEGFMLGKLANKFTSPSSGSADMGDSGFCTIL